MVQQLAPTQLGRMIQDFQDLSEVPITVGRANMVGNSIRAYLIRLADSTEAERHVMCSLLRESQRVECGDRRAVDQLRRDLARAVVVLKR